MNLWVCFIESRRWARPPSLSSTHQLSLPNGRVEWKLIERRGGGPKRLMNGDNCLASFKRARELPAIEFVWFFFSLFWVGYGLHSSHSSAQKREQEEKTKLIQQRKKRISGNEIEINQMSLIDWNGMSLGGLQANWWEVELVGWCWMDCGLWACPASQCSAIKEASHHKPTNCLFFNFINSSFTFPFLSVKRVKGRRLTAAAKKERGKGREEPR